jgi:hypothetical protein
MKVLHGIFALTLFSALLLTGGCKKEENNGPCGANFNWAIELQDEAQALSAAAQAYGQDPSPANCEAYRAAAQAYLDVAADLDNCVLGVNRPDYEQAVAEAQAEVDALQC